MTEDEKNGWRGRVEASLEFMKAAIVDIRDGLEDMHEVCSATRNGFGNRITRIETQCNEKKASAKMNVAVIAAIGALVASCASLLKAL